MARPSLTSRLMMFALKETLFSLVLLFGGGYLLIGFLEFQGSALADKVLPAIYVFGMWPFVLMVAAGLVFGYLAHDKARG